MRAENFIAFFTVCGFFIGIVFTLLKVNEPVEMLVYTLVITLFFYLIIHIVTNKNTKRSQTISSLS